jgi:hypothetical protein
MTRRADFTEDDWRVVLEGPPTAGMIVVTAQRGGTFRETFAIAKTYVEARAQHGESGLRNEIVSASRRSTAAATTRPRSSENTACSIFAMRSNCSSARPHPRNSTTTSASSSTSPTRSPTLTAKAERASAPTSVRPSKRSQRASVQPLHRFVDPTMEEIETFSTRLPIAFTGRRSSGADVVPVEPVHV